MTPSRSSTVCWISADMIVGDLDGDLADGRTDPPHRRALGSHRRGAPRACRHAYGRTRGGLRSRADPRRRAWCAARAIRRVEAGKSLVVVYRERNASDGFVITAFVTRRLPAIDRR